MPSGRAMSTICRTGMICPVRFVMWVTSITFVRGVIAATNCSTMYLSDGGGTLNEICFRTIPSRRTRCSHEVIIRP